MKFQVINIKKQISATTESLKTSVFNEKNSNIRSNPRLQANCSSYYFIQCPGGVLCFQNTTKSFNTTRTLDRPGGVLRIKSASGFLHAFPQTYLESNF